MKAIISKNGHSNDSLFELSDITHKYNPTDLDIYFKNAFMDYGIELHTSDLVNCNEAIFELHIGTDSPLQQGVNAKYLFTMENPEHENRSCSHIKSFKKIFSWDAPGYSWHKGFEHTLIPHPLKFDKEFEDFSNRKEFLCLINANKAFKKYVKDDLYKERLDFIKWAIKEIPNSFNLYGIGWNKPYPGIGLKGKLLRNLQSLFMKITGNKPFKPVYKGEVANKSDIYRNHKFAICYENIGGLNNYITEKILDAMSYGCVPIYLGAPDISEFIPSNCYIDRRQFASNPELFSYLKDISQGEFSLYQKNIESFFMHKAKLNFSFKATAGKVVQSIVGDIGL